MGTNVKRCYCHTCGKWFHHLGINGHRAAHRRKRESCEITYTSGERKSFNYGLKNPSLVDKGVKMKQNIYYVECFYNFIAQHPVVARDGKIIARRFKGMMYEDAEARAEKLAAILNARLKRGTV